MGGEFYPGVAAGTIVAFIMLYWQRSRASRLPKVLVCVLIGVVGMALAIVGPDAIRAGAERWRGATPQADTVDPGRRIVQVGGRSVVLPAPSGFVMIGPELPELLEAIEAGVIDNTRRVVTLVDEDSHARLLKGEQFEWQRMLYVDVTKQVERVHFSLAEFAEVKAVMQKLFDKLMANRGKMSPERFEELERDAGRAFNARERAAFVDPVRLPAHRETDRVLAFSSFKAESNGTTSATTWSMVLVKDVLINLKVAGQKADLAWTRAVADQWTDAVLAANGH